MAHIKFEKTLTENPFVDELVYYTKILGYSTVLKDEQQALQNETKESLKAGELYVACVEGKVTYEILDYNKEVFEMAGIPPVIWEPCLKDPTRIPEKYRNLAKEAAAKYYVEHYVEQNNYYRMLNGLPNYGDPSLFVTDEYLFYLPEELIIDLSKPIHKMSDYEINILESYDVLNAMRRDHPEAKYLDFLGQYKISIYEARSAYRFQPLYIDTIESKEIYDKYRDVLIKNRQFVLSTIYSEAYKYESDFYDGFIAVIIILQTMTDIISEVEEFIARKEIFDSRSIRYLLASNNIPYYGEIPIKYQKALIKNIHLLLKYKSTDKNIIDICSLFGFSDIRVFKYYLLKQRLTDDAGNFIFGFREELDDNGMSHYVQDDSVAYDLKFVKVPIEDNADDYIKSEANYLDYDQVTMADWSWANGVDPKELKNEILRRAFNYVRSKYYSIENICDASKLCFDIPYFYNVIFDNKKLEELLTITVHNIADNVSVFKLSDLFCYMLALTYKYHGLEDDLIAIDQEKSLSVLGFNFKADLEALNSYILEQGFTPEQLGIDKFTIPDTSILSMNQLVEVFLNNKKCYQNIIYGLRHAEDVHIYRIYKKLYDTLLLTEHTNEFFRLPNGRMPETMTEYLSYRDPALYKSIKTIEGLGEEEAVQKAIVENISSIVMALDEWLDGDDFKYIYHDMPGVSSEFVKAYIVRLINFFKSYKVDLIGIDTVYSFDGSLDNWVKVIDGIMDLNVSKTFTAFGIVKDVYTHKIWKDIPEHIKPKDKIYLDIRTWIYWLFDEDKVNIADTIYEIVVRHLLDEHVNLEDELEFMSKPIYADITSIRDIIYKVLVTKIIKEQVPIDIVIDTLMRTYIKYEHINIEDRLDGVWHSHDLSTILQVAETQSAKIYKRPTEKVFPLDKVTLNYVD